MLKTMKQVYDESIQSGIEFTCYGHLGDGHPHVSYLCKTPKEKKLAHTLVAGQCRHAVAVGGGVAAEHGIGKIKRDLLKIQYSKETLNKMRDLKKIFDPKWLLGRGNIFKA